MLNGCSEERVAASRWMCSTLSSLILLRLGPCAVDARCATNAFNMRLTGRRCSACGVGRRLLNVPK